MTYLADDVEVRHAMQLLKRAELVEGKIEETYQTTAVVKSRSGSNGKDNFASYVKIYWRVESDSTLPIDEYYFVRSEHRFAINGFYSATQLNAWNIARILSTWEDDRCNGS